VRVTRASDMRRSGPGEADVADSDRERKRVTPAQADLLRLQSTVGNAAVARLIASRTAQVSRFAIGDAIKSGVDSLQEGYQFVRELLAPIVLSASVGRGGVNNETDVEAVRRRLILLGFPPEAVPQGEDSRAAKLEALAAAIERFQAERVGVARPDGRVDVRGRTLPALNGRNVDDPAQPQPAVPGNQPAGPGGDEDLESDTSAELDPVRESIMERARNSEWPAHSEVYDRFRSSGVDLGIEGLADDWEGFLGQMREMDWLGHRVVGHETFLKRLHRAQTYLRSRYPGVPERELVPSINRPGSRSQWRAGERGTSYHVFGMALDIAAGANPWISNPEAPNRSARYHWAIWRAVWLAGDGAEPVTPEHSTEFARTASTQQLWEHYHAASAAVGRYFRLADDPAELARRVQALGAPPARQPSYDYVPAAFPANTLTSTEQWQSVIANDAEGWPGDPAQDERGFMNLRLELVQALRDHADLAWGGCDIGASDSGDFMHFDLRTPAFERLRREIRRAA